MAKVATKLLLLVFVLSFVVESAAQEKPLERRLSLTIEQVKLEDALFLISETGGFNFCYNSKLLETGKLVDVNAADETVSSILKKLFGNGMDVVPVGNHVILRNKNIQSAVQPEQQIEISGLVIDDHSGQRIPNVTVFEDFRKKAVQTDANGRFSIQLPSSIRSVALSFGKSGYVDTSIVIIPQKSMRLIVGVAREGVIGPVAVIPPTELVAGASDADQNPPSTTENPSTQTRKPRRTVPVQISAFPMVGSNGINQFGTDNYFSFNVFAGITKGVKGFELGSVANVNLENMYGLQIAGAANIVGADVRGIQITQGYNYVGQDAKGTQLSMAGNHVKGSMTGVQATMAGNIVMGNFSGWQMTVLANISLGRMNGFQLAQGYNYAGKDAEGVQISGIGNHVRQNMVGWQLSSGVNLVENDFRGLQMTALLNYARKVKGVQFGIINISDTIQGVAIGLVNISKNGYLRVEQESSDLLHNSLRFKSGTNSLYTILESGVRWGNGLAGYAFGAGLGARVEYAKKRMFSEFDIDAFWMVETHVPVTELNVVTRFSPTIGVKIFGPVELHVGPTFVYHHSNIKDANDGTFNTKLGFFPFYRDERYDINLLQQMWVGIKGGVQFNLNWRKAKG